MITKRKVQPQRKSQKNVFSLSISLLILVSVGITVFLVQRQQDIRQYADANSIEAEYNPFGDRWVEKKQPTNQMIKTALTTGCYRSGSKRDQTAPTAEEIAFWSKSNAGFVFEECAIFAEDARTKQYYQNLTNALTPSGVKYVAYEVILQADVNQTGVSEFYNGKPVPGYEDFFLYNPDKSLKRDADGHPLLNLTNARLRTHLITKLVDYMNRTGIGGVLIDTGYSAAFLRDRGLLDVDKVFTNTDAPITHWDTNYIEFMKDLHTAMNQNGKNRLLFVNVDVDNTDFISALLPSVDGIMLEDPLGPISIDTASRYKRVAPVLDKAAALDKYVLVVVNTNSNCTTSDTISCFKEYLAGGDLENRQKDFSDYYLAEYLNLIRNNKTVFMYYTPTQVGPQFVSQTFFKNWDLEIGDPIGASTEIAPGVFFRKFQNASVYVNTSNTSYPLVSINDAPSDNRGDTVNTAIPAKSGKILMNGADGSRAATITSSFHLQPISVSCLGPNNPQVHLEWTSPGDHEYKVFIRDQFNNGVETEVGRTNGTAFNVNTSQGLLPGHAYGFLIGYTTPAKESIFSDQAWSDSIYGWTQILTCNQ